MKRDCVLRGQSRRDFIRGVVSASAVLGVGPTRALEVLDRLGGSAMAEEACAPAARSVNIVAGDGGFAWFTLLWPVPALLEAPVAGQALDDPGRIAKVIADKGHPLYARKVDGKALWENLGPRKLVSAVVSGRAIVHDAAPDGGTTTLPEGVGGAVQLFAGQGALQQSLSGVLVPVIAIRNPKKPMAYGRSPGAPPAPAVVGGADEMVSLFSSAASRLAGRLERPENRELFEQFQSAFVSLARTADRKTYQRAYRDSHVAVSLLGQNLADVLRPDPAIVARWCGAALGDPKVAELARALLVTANAFKRGLTSQVILPAFYDDPHGAFGDVGRVSRIADGTARVLQSFLDDLSTVDEPLCMGKGRKLSDNLVLTVSGDTPKTPFVASAWPDGPPGGANWIYVMSNGYMKPGWFGSVNPNGKTHFDPSTGAEAAASESAITSASSAAILYSVIKGDDRRVREFFPGEYRGLVIPPNS